MEREKNIDIYSYCTNICIKISKDNNSLEECKKICDIYFNSLNKQELFEKIQKFK